MPGLDFGPLEADFGLMQKMILSAMLVVALSAPTLAADYPVAGKWGQSSSVEKGPVDCGKLRVIEFSGDTRTDSNGGVPAYRLRSATPENPGRYRIVDEFTTGQIRNAHLNYTLTQVDTDRIELNMQPGGLVKLRRCK